jgi:hypothetical protein
MDAQITAALGGAIVGLAIGAIIAALTLVRPSRWTIICRLSRELHSKLKRAAERRHLSVRDEILRRLSREDRP